MKTINKILETTFVALLVASVGCKQTTADDVGALRFAISLPDGTAINAIDWALRTSGGMVVEMGTITTTNPKATASLATDIPTGMGYTITMSGMTTAGVTCMGTSASFNVGAGQTTPVSVNIVCGSVSSDAGTGTVVVQSTVVPGDSCPVMTQSLISPRVTGVGELISVMASASDADPGDTLSYMWSATAGTFTSASLASTDYHCPATAGMQTLTLRISDNHMPTPCTTVVTFPTVDCQ